MIQKLVDWVIVTLWLSTSCLYLKKVIKLYCLLMSGCSQVLCSLTCIPHTFWVKLGYCFCNLYWSACAILCTIVADNERYKDIIVYTFYTHAYILTKWHDCLIWFHLIMLFWVYNNSFHVVMLLFFLFVNEDLETTWE